MSSPYLLISELSDKASFSHSTISAQENFEQMVVVTVHNDYLDSDRRRKYYNL